MKTWVFYFRGISVNIYDKALLSSLQKKALKADGFQKIAISFKADNEESAVDQFIEHYKANTDALREFSKDMSFAAAIFCLLR